MRDCKAHGEIDCRTECHSCMAPGRTLRCVTKGSIRVLSHSSLRWCSRRPGGVWHFAWNRGFTLEELGEESCILSPCSAGSWCHNRHGYAMRHCASFASCGSPDQLLQASIESVVLCGAPGNRLLDGLQ